MSLLCIGSNFDGVEMNDHFHERGQVWLNEIPPENGEILPMTTLLDQAKIGTWIVIKSFHPQNGLSIKGIGYIYDNQNWNSYEMDNPNVTKIARFVRWIWKGNKCLGKFNDHMDHMRTGPMYYELNENVAGQIFDILNPV